MKESNHKFSRKDFFGNVKKSFSGRKFRSGAYVTLVSAIVIIMILVVNMIFSKINIQLDLSKEGLYTLSEDTNKLLEGLEDEVTIYYLVAAGNEYDMYQNIVTQYEKASSKINLVYKDPVLYPKFASDYVEDDVTENSFLVVNNRTKVGKYIDSNEMMIQEMDYSTYQTSTTGIDVEGRLTSAIQYVTTTDRSKLYLVEGHGEADIGTTFTTTAEKMNIETASLPTVTEATIPEDCDILFINGPQYDYSTEEVTMIKDYLAKGGKAIITVDYMAKDLPNVQSLLDYYGIVMEEGVVIESDPNMHSANYITALLPEIESSDITKQAEDSEVPVAMLLASGLRIQNTLRSSLTVEPLLSTSEGAYSKVNTQATTTNKEEGDIEGPFYLGLFASDTYKDATSKVVVFSAGAYTFGDETVNFSNQKLLSGTFGYLVGDMDLISIPTKSLADTYITTTSQQTVMLLALAMVIPIFILITGGVICYRRRKK